MTITEIENLTYEEVKRMSVEKLDIKEHDVFLADLGEYFGYSALVFKNGKHIYHANDYELHHSSMNREELRYYYIGSLNNKLFTEEELMWKINSYDEYRAKLYYITNYHIQAYDYLSMFQIFHNNIERIKFEKLKKKYPLKNSISCCYMKEEDKDVIKKQKMIYDHLKKSFLELRSNNDVFRGMVSYQLANHEACITCSYYDALDSLGLKFEELDSDKQKIVLEELNEQIEKYNSW